MAGILSQGTGMTGGVLSRQPQSMLQRLGLNIDLGSPDNQVPLAFLNNVISTPGASPFQGVAEAAQNSQVMNQRKVELSQIVKKRQQEDEQTAAFRKMVANDPAATQLLNAGQPQAALELYQRKNGLLPPDYMSVNAGDSVVDKNNMGAGPMFSAPPKLPTATPRAGTGSPVNYRNKTTGEIRAVQPMTVGPGQDMLSGGNLPGNQSDWEYIDPATMAGDKAAIAGDAKTASAARGMLPAAEQTYKIATQAADALLNDKTGMADQFGNFLGFPNQKLPAAYPGTPMARFRTELQQGQGNAFLQARAVLKGGGQITDYEGAKAEAAYSRMTLAADNNNQDEFIAAVTDFKQAVQDGYDKIKAAAAGDYAAGKQGGGSDDPLGIR